MNNRILPLNTAEAAAQLAALRGVDKLSTDQIRIYIKNGYLPARKNGRDWHIWPDDLLLVKDRHRGREPKNNS